jgi:hypothetical protein
LRSCAFFIAWFLANILFSQNPPESRQDSLRTSIRPAADSLVFRETPDSLVSPADSLRKKKPPRSDIATTINYHARDSMLFDLENQKLELFGETHVDYGTISLDAEKTEIDWVKRQIKSDFVEDSLGNKKGKPVFTDRGDVYVTEDILYDFKSRKALIRGVVTEQDGAFMHGTNVKKNEVNEMFIVDAQYTTCNLEHPHFFIESKRLKVIPGNKVVSGPFHMKFREVPTPIWGPFGMFPQPRKKASGIIVPAYGEEQRRGFFLRDGGYYFAISDYMDLRITGDLYSQGGHALNINQNYIKRYKFRGTFNFAYTRNVLGSLVNTSEQNTYWLTWNHAPQSRGNSRFSASASFGSSSFNENNNLAINQSTFQRSVQANYQSNISYSTRFRGTPYSMTSNARMNQNIQSRVVSLTLPEVTFNMNRIFPLKNLTQKSNSVLAKLNLSHTFSVRNELTNAARSEFPFEVSNPNNDRADTLAFNGQNLPEIYERSRIGGRHNVPISTSFNLFNYFTVTPSFNFTELWYLRELQFSDFNAEEGGVRVDTLRGFSRAGSWRSSASINTRFYGTYNIGGKSIQAIRHVVIPSVGFTYNPDFGDPRYGVYSDVVVDSLGNTRRLSKFEGFIFGSPPGGESRTMSFSVSNNIEMKVLDKSDSTGESYKKIKILENLAANAGYNFAADSFKLSTISLNARTSFFQGKLSVATNATLDPYIYKLISRNENGAVQQRRLDRYAWNNGQGLGQLSNFSTSLNLNLSGRSSRNDGPNNLNPNSVDNDPFNANTVDPFATPEEQERQRVIADMINNPEQYVDFTVPWSLRASYRFSRTKQGFEDPTVRQSMTFGGSLGLTDKTQITFNSGYDFDAREFTTTRISVNRDLHCWTMSFNWVPFGNFQSYMITINAKSPILQDLKVEKRRAFQDFFSN